MTNTTIPAESLGASSAAASFYRWEVAGKPIAVQLSLDLLDRLEREVLESFRAVTKRGSEIGGVLAGHVLSGNPRTVVIDRFEPVECDYSRGPLYLLADADKARLKETVERVRNSGIVAGFFRSNTRRDIVMDEEDLAIVSEFFSDPANVVLLVRPYAMKPSAGAFFIWENGQVHGESSYLQFPFKRAELLKNFAQFIVDGSDAAPAPPAKEPLVMPKREEPAPPPPVSKREEPPQAPAPKREEAPPITFKREERPAIIPPSARREDRPPLLKREERPAIVPAAPKREERPAGPTLVSKKEEKPQPAPKREEKAAVTAAPPKPAEEKPAVTQAAPVVPEKVAPEKKEEPAPPKPEHLEAAALRSPAVTSPAPAFAEETEPEPPGLFSRLKWVIVLVVVAALGAGGYFAYQKYMQPAPEASKPADSTLALKVERSAGQLLLSWNRNSPLIATATRATLSITDGDHREDVDLDLGQLHNGSIVYAPMTNDVSFRLEVTDLKNGKSAGESVRVLAGRPSPTVSALPASAAKPAPGAPDAKTAVAPLQPAGTPAAAQQQTAQAPPPVEQPKVTAGPAVTAAPPKPESLAARLRAAEPQELPAPPTLEGSSSTLAGSAPVGTTHLPAAPPTPAAQAPKPATPQAQPQQPAPPTGGRAVEAKLIRRVAPVYPSLARQTRVSGIVRVRATVGKDGKVRKAVAISGPPLLRQAASEAVRLWIYTPAMLNGEPIDSETQVDVSFMM